jgi:primosomal protein N' (replication factor Y)
VETPRHSAVGGLLDYTSEQALAPGTLIRVPLGKRELPGVVWDAAPSGAVCDTDLRAVASVLDAMPVLDADWRALVAFAAATTSADWESWP